jgi:metallo-beta-lactamase family protein
MNLSFYGAARSVTGSRHLLETGGARLLLDCGLFQGHRQDADVRNHDLGFDPRSLDAVLLSHAHIDHSGALPVLSKRGFKGRVYATDATCDLANLMLQDSAKVQEQDCGYINRKERRRGRRCRAPYYDTDDVSDIVRRFSSLRYREEVKIGRRVSASFQDAGHILGSGAVHLNIHHKGLRTSILFSGDLGRRGMPILRDPDPPPPCDVLILESTYGDRLHEQDAEERTRMAKELFAHAIAYRSKIIVPAFAIGRTQDLVMRIKHLVRAGTVPPIPIYIDSPLAFKATDIFRAHPDLFDEETFRTFLQDGDPFGARYIRYVSTSKESKQLNDVKGPCVIIASSGMCEGGRVLHHLKHAVADPANVIAIVGFQAEHTLGRKLVERWDTVPIFGIPTPLRARVVVFNGFSAHADRNDLLAYARAITPLPGQIFIVHGEEKQSLSLAAAIQAEHAKVNVTVPRQGATYEL